MILWSVYSKTICSIHLRCPGAGSKAGGKCCFFFGGGGSWMAPSGFENQLDCRWICYDQHEFDEFLFFLVKKLGFCHCHFVWQLVYWQLVTSVLDVLGIGHKSMPGTEEWKKLMCLMAHYDSILGCLSRQIAPKYEVSSWLLNLNKIMVPQFFPPRQWYPIPKAQKYILRVILTNWHLSDINSDILFDIQSIWTYILAHTQTFWKFYCIWHFLWHSIWHQTFYLTYIQYIYIHIHTFWHSLWLLLRTDPVGFRV